MALRAGDLKGTVSDLISIDEYKPKTGTDSEIVVVAFYAIDEDPAKDVDSFLERSSMDLVDVEVSPNPNEDGFYIIFVEMYRNESFPKELLLLIKEMDRITGGMQWKVSPYLADNVYDINDDAWKQYVIYDKNAYMTKSDYKKKNNIQTTKESVYEYFKNTDLRNLQLNDKKCTFHGSRGIVTLEMLDLCDQKTLSEKYDFDNQPILWEKIDPVALTLRVMLGEGWDVIHHSDSIMVLNSWDDRIFYGRSC